MTAKKTESDADDLIHYRHPDGHWQEMTKAEAARLDKEQESGKAAPPEKETAK